MWSAKLIMMNLGKAVLALGTLRLQSLGAVRCEKKDMLLIRYEAPDGQMRHTRLWNGGNGKGTVLLFHDGKLNQIPLP